MNNILSALGLSQKEVTTYTTLLSLGIASPSEVAKQLPIPRPTVYKILEDLEKKGFIKTDISSKKKVFFVTPMEELESILSPYKYALKEKEQLIEELKPLVKKEQINASGYHPKIQYIPQERIESHLRSQAPKWNKSMHDTKTEYVGYQDTSYTPLIQDWIIWYWKQPSTKGITLRILSNDSDFEANSTETKAIKNRTILPWSGLGEVTFSTWINGDYVILINIRQRPFYLIEIYDPAYAESQRQIFEAVWKIASNT